MKGMKPLEIAEYLMLAALCVVCTWSWELAIWMLVIFSVIVIARIIVTKKIGNPTLTKLMKLGLCMMAGYYIWQGITLFYTDNLSEGLGFMEKRLSLLALPLMLLLSDTSYLTPLRKRNLLYVFTASLVVRFFFRLTATLIAGNGIFVPVFDPVHHSYMALFLLMAIGFIYSEWVNHRSELPRWMPWTLCGTFIVMVAYLILIDSRTGIAGLALIVLFIVIHQIVRQRNYKIGIALILCFLAAGCIMHFALPESEKRLTQTFQNINSSKGDDRVGIYKCSLKASIDHLPWGTGVRDSKPVLEEYFIADGHDWSNLKELNTHNIYLETLLTLGLPGILLLLAMLILPTIDACRRRDITLLTLMFVFAFGGLFEAILSRQVWFMFMVPMCYALASCERGRQRDLPDSL